MTIQRMDFPNAPDGAKRLDQIGWGIFLIMIGTIWLVPTVPQGTWLIGTGVLLLALNVIRFTKGIQWSGVSTALGTFALIAGLSALAGINVPLFPICLVIIGVGLVLRTVASEHA